MVCNKQPLVVRMILLGHEPLSRAHWWSCTVKHQQVDRYHQPVKHRHSDHQRVNSHQPKLIISQFMSNHHKPVTREASSAKILATNLCMWPAMSTLSPSFDWAIPGDHWDPGDHGISSSMVPEGSWTWTVQGRGRSQVAGDNMRISVTGWSIEWIEWIEWTDDMVSSDS